MHIHVETKSRVWFLRYTYIGNHSFIIDPFYVQQPIKLLPFNSVYSFQTKKTHLCRTVLNSSIIFFKEKKFSGGGRIELENVLT